MGVASEFAIGGVYVPPLLVSATFGLLLAGLTARLLDRYRLSRVFFYPPLVYVALTVIFTVVVSTFVIPG